MMASFRSPARLYLRATYTSALFDRGHATPQGRGTELNLRATCTYVDISTGDVPRDAGHDDVARISRPRL